jgi:hypothetical protein
VNTSGNVVGGKTFAAITECCNKKCYEKFTLDEQNDSFISLFKSGSKSLQDSFLASCMKVKDDTKVKRPTTDPKQNRVYTWTYSLKTEGVVQEVCRKFIVQLFQVSIKRVRVIQCKVTSNKSFEEKPGSHLNRSHKTDSVWDLVLPHLQTLPHKKSHYGQQISKRFCLENPNLTVVELFRLFQSYFLKKYWKTTKNGLQNVL